MTEIKQRLEDQSIRDSRRAAWQAASTARDRDAPRRAIEDMKALKALVVWLAGKLNITPAQARDEIIEIYKSL